MTTIVDTGHRINTEPELEFTELVERPKLSPAEILGNLYSWIEQDLATSPFEGRGKKTATDFDLEMSRRDGLLAVKAHLDRLGAIDFVA